MSERSGEIIFWKPLELSLPDLAHIQILNYPPADLPVFVANGMFRDINGCRICKVDSYPPLIFQGGSIVEPHHFHPEEKMEVGGIRCFINMPDESVSGWAAILEPLGRTIRDDERVTGITAERVKVVKILADCSRKRLCGSETLEKGFVYEFGNGHLLPVCSSAKHPELASELRFTFRTTEDREVVFSPLK